MKRAILAISGPSAVGKTTMADCLIQKYPNLFEQPVAFTTRDKRIGEINGEDYHFIDRETIEKLSKESQLMTLLDFGGNLYGYTQSSIESVLEKGKIPLCLIGADSIAGMRGKAEALEIPFVSIFIVPNEPAVCGTCRRLVERGASSPEIGKRLKLMSGEIELGTKAAKHSIERVEGVNAMLEKIEKVLKQEGIITHDLVCSHSNPSHSFNP